MTHSFLVELGTEELPPTSLKELSLAFNANIEKGLQQHKLAFTQLQGFASPRRLAVLIHGLEEATPLENNKAWGPPAKIAFDKDGKPSKAAQAFAKKNGVSVDELATENDGKQDKLVCTVASGGLATKTLLSTVVNEALANLPIKKRMRWGASRVEFVRPIQWLVMLLDDDILPGEVLGVSAGNESRGHRFHANTAIAIDRIDHYESQLHTAGKVIADFAKRQAIIVEQVQAAAEQIGGHAVIGEDLLDEVTALVEWPVALAGKFDSAFLEIPAEALISSMKEHQKYFHVVDGNGHLLPHFITVANIDSKDAAQVIDGNERVIRPRLSDAAFFFNTDKKTSLAARREKLKSVTFQAQLGSVFDKTERIERLSIFIAEHLGIDTQHCARAAQLCKSDLVSAMVYEFADMQGIAGSHYARHDGEDESVALAMTEQYMPKFAGDSVPSSDVGAIVALADRLDTVSGIFGIGQKPSGSKDPFALRRASLGILRILVEKHYPLDLKTLVKFAVEGFRDLPAADTVVDEVLSYCLERFRAWYQEAGISAEVFYSVQAKQLSAPLDINQRVLAVAAFAKLPEALSLAEANKRVSNILAKYTEAVKDTVDAKLLREPAEQALASALEDAIERFTPLFEKNAYEDALCSLAALKTPVDTFFDDVMVMCDDPELRSNRLALLSKLRGVFLHIADISLLVVKAK